eukprot:CAMPEP_0117544746 /NCGR_PEP_ID=MMETSP0784-20121206/45735_1 /TAXON_ID=39447 /ORGANISM="" /LENGTH=419 /DNA_ID=CAMNT_0005341565 /DNA_START=37 /DNA_END=1297 /DNA_ORIENTATION=+
MALKSHCATSSSWFSVWRGGTIGPPVNLGLRYCIVNFDQRVFSHAPNSTGTGASVHVPFDDFAGIETVPSQPTGAERHAGPGTGRQVAGPVVVQPQFPVVLRLRQQVRLILVASSLTVSLHWAELLREANHLARLGDVLSDCLPSRPRLASPSLASLSTADGVSHAGTAESSEFEEVCNDIAYDLDAEAKLEGRESRAALTACGSTPSAAIDSALKPAASHRAAGTSATLSSTSRADEDLALPAAAARRAPARSTTWGATSRAAADLALLPAAVPRTASSTAEREAASRAAADPALLPEAASRKSVRSLPKSKRLRSRARGGERPCPAVESTALDLGQGGPFAARAVATAPDPTLRRGGASQEPWMPRLALLQTSLWCYGLAAQSLVRPGTATVRGEHKGEKGDGAPSTSTHTARIRRP